MNESVIFIRKFVRQTNTHFIHFIDLWGNTETLSLNIDNYFCPYKAPLNKIIYTLLHLSLNLMRWILKYQLDFIYKL